MNAPKSKERVLVVDGNWQISGYFARVLSAAGYEVVKVDTAKEALDVVAGDKGGFDLVISEVFFKREMNGPTLLRELRKAGREMRCIFVSGYSEDGVRKPLHENEEYAFLQ